MTKSFKNRDKANKIEDNCDQFVDKLQEVSEASVSVKMNK